MGMEMESVLIEEFRIGACRCLERHGRLLVGLDIRLACLVPWIHTLDTNLLVIEIPYLNITQ